MSVHTTSDGSRAFLFLPCTDRWVTMTLEYTRTVSNSAHRHAGRPDGYIRRIYIHIYIRMSLLLSTAPGEGAHAGYRTYQTKCVNSTIK